MSNTATKSASRPAPPLIAITSGEPAGIGPDICLCLAQRQWPARLVVLGDRDLLAARARQLGLDATRIEIRHVALRESALAGRLDTSNSPYVLDMLDAALDGCVAGDYAAMDPTQAARRIQELEQRMYQHARDLEFEDAAQVRDQIRRIREAALGA